jgi:hypothetical protein
MKTDKIDINLVGAKLSPGQCEIAIAIWRKKKVFEALSDTVSTLTNFDEPSIWEMTFYNYSKNDKDYDKMYRLTTQIIDFYRLTFPSRWNDIARVVRYVKGVPRNLICKPSKADIHRDFNWRINTAATHAVKADRIQKIEPSIPVSAVAQFVVKCCNKLSDAEQIEWCNRIEESASTHRIEKEKTLALIESSKELEKECHPKDDIEPDRESE